MSDFIMEVDTASGGTYSLQVKGGLPELECVEPAKSPIAARVGAVLVGGTVLTALLFGLHYSIGTASSEVMYGLYAAPCCHPLLGLGIAYGIARASERRAQTGDEQTIELGAIVVFDDAPQGKLLHIVQDLAAPTLTLVCEEGSKVLACREAADVVALAHAIEVARSRTTV